MSKPFFEQRRERRKVLRFSNQEVMVALVFAGLRRS